MDLDMSVEVTRTALGLTSLELNDFERYYVGATFFGGTVSWKRTTIGSPWTDGEVTTNRTRGNVQEQVTVECLGEDANGAYLAAEELIQAFIQDTFDVAITIGALERTYRCEAADYSVSWTGPRMVGGQILVTLAMPRQPVPLLGVA